MRSNFADNPVWFSLGDQALMLDFTGFQPVTNPQSATATPASISHYISQLHRHIIAKNITGITDSVPSLTRLMISFDPSVISASAVKQAVIYLMNDPQTQPTSTARHWALPICYDHDCGPDIKAIAKATSLSSQEVIARHLASRFEVTVMGFMPGLGYLTGLDAALTLPRLAKPRTHVEARSVGIAIGQCVIYPMASPGGWNLIGKTSARIFDPHRADPILFQTGDQISFYRVRYDVLQQQDKSYDSQSFTASDYQKQAS